MSPDAVATRDCSGPMVGTSLQCTCSSGPEQKDMVWCEDRQLLLSCLLAGAPSTLLPAVTCRSQAFLMTTLDSQKVLGLPSFSREKTAIEGY